MNYSNNNELNELFNFFTSNGVVAKINDENILISVFLWVKVRVHKDSNNYILSTEEWKNGVLFIMFSAWALMTKDNMLANVLFMTVSLFNLIVFLGKIKISILYSKFEW